jgi:hypothetical protein
VLTAETYSLSARGRQTSLELEFDLEILSFNRLVNRLSHALISESSAQSMATCVNAICGASEANGAGVQDYPSRHT